MNKSYTVTKSIGVSILLIVEYLALRYLVSYLVYLYFSTQSIKYAGLNTRELMSVTTIPNLLIGNSLVVFVYIMLHFNKSKIKSMFSSLSKMSHIFTYITLGLIVNATMSFLITMLFADANIQINNDTTNEVMNTVSYSLWFIVVASGIITPISEEFVYRYGILGALRKSMSDGWSIFLSALIFGVMHASLVQGVYAFFLGLLFGYCVCKRDGNILTSIIMHMTINITSLILSFTGMSNLFVMIWLICTFGLIARLFNYFERRSVN